MHKSSSFYWQLSLFLLTFLLIHLTFSDVSAAAPGDPLPRINCIDGYSATIYAEGLAGPHGLAINPSGELYVSEDSGGRVSQIGSSGTVTAVLTSLANPEGITFDSDANLYVVEDVANGRLIQQTANLNQTVIATNLQAPEGVVVAANGVVYVTGSELQLLSPSPTQSEIEATEAYLIAYAATSPFTPTTLLTTTPDLTINLFPPSVDIKFDSLTAIAQGDDGLLYLTNELSGLNVMTTTEIANPFGVPPTITVDVTFSSTNAIYAIDPINPPASLPAAFASNLVTPEGPNFATSGQFPLYVAEEDSSGANQNGTGRLSRITNDGTHTILCTGFSTIEDVIVDKSGNIFVAEDGTGLVIKLTSASCVAPTAVTNTTATRNGALLNLNWAGSADHYLIHQATTPYFTPSALSCPADANCQLSPIESYSQTVSATNLFLQVRAVDTCGATTPPTQTQGIFNFALQSGT